MEIRFAKGWIHSWQQLCILTYFAARAKSCMNSNPQAFLPETRGQPDLVFSIFLHKLTRCLLCIYLPKQRINFFPLRQP